jgi:pimeloyl-ACP methyl ester carboxylesterase
MTSSAYLERRPSRSEFIQLRGLRHHVRTWGDRSLVTPERPALVMMHGWMDVGASFQFAVDAMHTDRFVIAPDWRGFGLTESPAADSYWFPDYLGDLDALLDHLVPDQAIDLVGHSMGGNVVMLYAGIRPQRIRRLVNLEGFGQPEFRAASTPKHYARWLDELKAPQTLSDYASVDDVARRLQKNNPLLPADRAAWLAAHWSRPDAKGRWQILGDAAHKRSNAVPYSKDGVLACWAKIEAPLMWVEGDRTDLVKWWGNRYSKTEFHERLGVVKNVEKHVLSPAGHMLHHDQPEALAAHLEAFLAA